MPRGETVSAHSADRGVCGLRLFALQKKIRDLTEEEMGELELATDEALGRVESPPM